MKINIYKTQQDEVQTMHSSDDYSFIYLLEMKTFMFTIAHLFYTDWFYYESYKANQCQKSMSVLNIVAQRIDILYRIKTFPHGVNYWWFHTNLIKNMYVFMFTL